MPIPALFKRPKEGLQVIKVGDEKVDQETQMMGGRMFLATQDAYERISRELSRGSRFHRDKWRSYLRWIARRGNAYRTICCSSPADDYTFEHFLDLLKLCPQVYECEASGIKWSENGRDYLIHCASSLFQTSASLAVAVSAYQKDLLSYRLPASRTSALTLDEKVFECIQDELMEQQMRAASLKCRIKRFGVSTRDADDILDLVQQSHQHVSTARNLLTLYHEISRWLQNLKETPFLHAHFTSIQRFWRTAQLRVKIAGSALQTPWLMHQDVSRLVSDVIEMLPNLEKFREMGTMSLAALEFLGEDGDSGSHPAVGITIGALLDSSMAAQQAGASLQEAFSVD